MKHNIGDVVEFKQRKDWCTCVGVIKDIIDNTYTIALNYIIVHGVKEEQITKNRGKFENE